MERKNVLVSGEELARQKEYMQKVRAIADTLTRAPLALVDTFGCQQNVADGEVLAGMLEEMGYTWTDEREEADLIHRSSPQYNFDYIIIFYYLLPRLASALRAGTKESRFPVVSCQFTQKYMDESDKSML